MTDRVGLVLMWDLNEEGDFVIDLETEAETGLASVTLNLETVLDGIEQDLETPEHYEFSEAVDVWLLAAQRLRELADNIQAKVREYAS